MIWTLKEYSKVLAHLFTAIPAVLFSLVVSAIDPDVEYEVDSLEFAAD